MSIRVVHSVRINKEIATRDRVPSVHLNSLQQPVKPEELYQLLQCGYPKFFKMDALSKWAWIGAEYLLRENGGFVYDGLDKEKIGVVLSTNHGCLEVDKRYQETTATIPSPALFVYTLPNIMLGEICIRHGFKGEQLCTVQPQADTDDQFFWVNDLLQHRHMDACIAGFVDAAPGQPAVELYWIVK